MATPRFNTKSPTIKRIRKYLPPLFLPTYPQYLAEFARLSRTKLTSLAPPVREAQELSASPSPDYTAAPIESDLFEWHFTLRGPPNSPYADGLYHGRIVLPATYPLRPPSFRFLTPSGRFEANREICLSISGHHEETWQPAWGVRTALVALRSFMETDPKGQLGGLDTSDAVRRTLAAQSRAWKCSGGCGGRANEEVMAECEEAARVAAEAADGKVNEEVVPPELRMGFRDEMEKNSAAAAASAAAAGGGTSGGSGPAAAPATIAEADAESAELAEGFVQTVPRANLSAGAAQPGQTVSQPTRTLPLPAQAHQPQQQQQAPLAQAQRPAAVVGGGVPQWIDRVIMTLVVCLVGMILKVLLAK